MSLFDECKLVEFNMDNVDDFTSRPQLFKRLDDDSHAIELAKQWNTIRATLKHLEEHEQALRKALIAIADGRNIKVGGIVIEKIIRRGMVDYSTIEALKDIDLNKYRKSSSENYRFTLEE